MRKRIFTLGLLTLASLGAAQETGYNTNWSGHRTLHVNTLNVSQTSTSISANVLRYPMLVRLTAADSAVFAASKSNGADIRFTKFNNTTRLQHSIEHWDSAGRNAAIWVLLDTVYANAFANNRFHMHWGNAAAADSSRPNAVFDSANGFEAVWHMGNAAAGLNPRPNSVAGGNPATPRAVGNYVTGAFVPRLGLIGMADTLRAGSTGGVTGQDSADHFTLGSGYRFAQGQGTLSVWVKLLTTGSWNNFIALSAGSTPGANINQGGRTDNIWMGRNSNTNTFVFRSSNRAVGDSGLESNALTVANALLPVDTWAHFTSVWQDSGRTRRVYKNGAQIGEFLVAANATDSVKAINLIRDTTRSLTFLGRSAWGSTDRNFRGMMDEVRISKVARSADWIALDYGSQNPTQTLVSDSTPPVIAYSVDTIHAQAGYPITAVLPTTFTGTPQPTVAVSPALPAGLTLSTANNANRGMISGTPIGAAGTTMHVITATNAKGTSSDTIYVVITGSTENYSTWTGSRTLTFSGSAAGISSTVSWYPFLVRLGNADSAVFAQAGAGGASLRFSRTDTVRLQYSIDHWDATARKAAVWVLMDQVVTGNNTLRMHWGNNSATSRSNPTAVFERSKGFVSVWHMGNPVGDSLTGARPNSVSPGYHDALPQYASAPVAAQIQDGVIGKADSLRGQSTAQNGDYFYLGAGPEYASNFPNGLTMSVWVKLFHPGTNFVQFFTLGNRTSPSGSCPPCLGTNGSNSIWVGRVGNANNQFATEALSGTTSGGRLDGPAGSAAPGEWHHVTMTLLGTTSNGQKLYRNGALMAQRTNTATLQSITRIANFLGRATWPDSTLRGWLDEARISDVIRDSNWIKLDYATQQPGAAPITLSYANISTTPGSNITTVNPTVSGGTPARYTITPALPDSLRFDTATGAITGRAPAGAYSATHTVTATSGIWSASAPVTINSVGADPAFTTANWSQNRYIRVNAGVVAPLNSTLLRFPVLVRLGPADSAIFNATQANGADIRFTKLNTANTRLRHEIDHWDAANRSAAIWVLLDTVYARTTGSRLRLWAGNATVADSSQPGAVFDSANGFVAVWHMGGNGSAQVRANSVPGGNPAVPAGSAANLSSGWGLRTGLIGLADSLRSASNSTSATNRAADDHLDLGLNQYANFTTGLTISMWAKPEEQAGYTGWVQYISFSNGQGNNNIWMGRRGNTMNLTAEVYDGTSSWGHIDAENVQVFGQWQHLVFTVTSTGNQRLYHNGLMVAEQMGNGPIPVFNRPQNHLGRSPWGDRNYRGVVDEVRVAKVARSAPWLLLEFENQKAAQTVTVLTANQEPVQTTSIDAASALMAGPALSFSAMGKGLLFQVRSEAAGKVRLEILDVQGRAVWNRTAETNPGMNQITWNGTSNNGQAIGSGVYAIRMTLLDAKGNPGESLVRKVPLGR